MKIPPEKAAAVFIFSGVISVGVLWIIIYLLPQKVSDLRFWEILLTMFIAHMAKGLLFMTSGKPKNPLTERDE